jgi:hypothetical protein
MNQRTLVTSFGFVATIALLLAMLATPGRIAAQSGYVASFTVNGQPTGSGQAPAADSTPTFAGEGTPGATITIRIEPGGAVLSATVGPDGKFRVEANQALSPGSYEVFLNNERMGPFTVSAPGPPATGNGLLEEAGGSNPLLAAFVALVLIGGGATFVARARR